MQWLNEPASWQRTGDVLRVNVDPGTDFWRTTGYGYVHDNGHVYGELLPGDLDVSVRVRGAFASQYDQAGIMLRADEETWLKTGLEFFEGRPRLSTVLTAGWSSWMVADLPPGTDEVTLRVSRRGDAVEVRYAAGDGAAELAALVYMPPDREMLAGIVCAAPEGNGFSVAFHDLRIVGREWGGQGADGADWASGSAVPPTGWAQEQAPAPGAGWAGEAEGWRDEQADAGVTGWAGDNPGGGTASWAEDKPGDGAPSWAGDKADDGPAPWTGDKPGDGTPSWAGDKADDGPAPWAMGKADAGVAGRAGDKPSEAVADWAGDKADDGVAPWARERADEPVSGRAGDKPDDRPAPSWEQETPGGLPAGWGDELPGNESVDWAKPLASEPAADWDRLSLSVSGSWNAFAAGEPAKEPAEEQPGLPVRKPRTGEASRAARAGHDSENGTGEMPELPAGDKTGSAPPEEDEPDARRRNGRGRKAKLPAPRSPITPTPADAADEWISLLTADSAEELSRFGRSRAGGAPAGERRAGANPPRENRPGDAPAKNGPWPGMRPARTESGQP
jgi:uncharacterized protein